MSNYNLREIAAIMRKYNNGWIIGGRQISSELLNLMERGGSASFIKQMYPNEIARSPQSIKKAFDNINKIITKFIDKLDLARMLTDNEEILVKINELMDQVIEISNDMITLYELTLHEVRTEVAVEVPIDEDLPELGNTIENVTRRSYVLSTLPQIIEDIYWVLTAMKIKLQNLEPAITSIKEEVKKQRKEIKAQRAADENAVKENPGYEYYDKLYELKEALQDGLPVEQIDQLIGSYLYPSEKYEEDQEILPSLPVRNILIDKIKFDALDDELNKIPMGNATRAWWMKTITLIREQQITPSILSEVLEAWKLHLQQDHPRLSDHSTVQLLEAIFAQVAAKKIPQTERFNRKRKNAEEEREENNNKRNREEKEREIKLNLDYNEDNLDDNSTVMQPDIDPIMDLANSAPTVYTTNSTNNNNINNINNNNNNADDATFNQELMWNMMMNGSGINRRRLLKAYGLDSHERAMNFVTNKIPKLYRKSMSASEKKVVENILIKSNAVQNPKKQIEYSITYLIKALPKLKGVVKQNVYKYLWNRGKDWKRRLKQFA